MAKGKWKHSLGRNGYTVKNMGEIGEVVTDYYGGLLRKFDKVFGDDNGADMMLRTFKAGAQPMIFDIERFMSEHEVTTETWGSFNEGVLIDNGQNWLDFKFGFDIKTGGLPALFLEYGDNGTPMRMPNRAYYFMYYAVENNIGHFKQLADEEVERMLSEIQR